MSRTKPDGQFHLERMLAEAGAKNFRPKTAFLIEAAKPSAQPEPALIEQYISDILHDLGKNDFLPGRDDEFWQSTGAQILVEAAWAIRPGDLITPAEAARLLLGDRFKHQSHRMNRIATAVRDGKLKAYPRPESLRS